MKLCKRIIAAVVMAAMLALCVPAFAVAEPDYPEVPEGYDGFITFEVSALTMGWTYLIDPVLVPVHEGETFITVTERAFEMLDWNYAITTSEYGSYLTGIGCYETEPFVPDYLMTEILNYPAWAEENFGYSMGEWTGEYDDDEMLTEYEYCGLSGWMFMVDGASTSDTIDTHVIQIGSVYTWFFTIYGWGMDYGISDGWGYFPAFDNPMAGVDRTEISRTLAQIDADEELSYNLIVNALEEFVDLLMLFYNPTSSQADLDAALAALLTAMDPGSVLMGDVNFDGVVDSSDALMVLRHAMQITQLSDEALAAADVDGNGVIDSSDALMILRASMDV